MNTVETTRLTPRDAARLLEFLEKPGPPSDALARAAERHARLVRPKQDRSDWTEANLGDLTD